MNLINVDSARLVEDAKLLAPIFPGRQHAEPARHLLHALAFSSADVTEDHVVATAKEAAEMRDALEQMPNVARDDQGVLIGFAGLSRTETLHTLILRPLGAEAPETVRYGWCAWDTMFLPVLLARSATVATMCPVTDAAITLHIADGVATCPSHPNAIVSLPLDGDFDADNARATFCCRARILADADAAEQWAAKMPGSAFYTIDAAMRLGALATAALMED